uniref:E3 ubiquitin protein ligase rnf34 n=1 Tax=Rhipicephalus appendiculatus TaxID=34631 RepID=A0A131YI03_RHIAP
MGAPAFMKEFREFMNFNSDGSMFGGSTQSRLGSCDSCLTKFGLLKRRHACDQCGTDFCAACVRGRRCPRCRALAGGRPALLALRPRDLRALLRARGLAPPLGAREKAELVDLLLLESTGRPGASTGSRSGQPEWPERPAWTEHVERPRFPERPEQRDSPEQAERQGERVEIPVQPGPTAYVPPPPWGGPFPGMSSEEPVREPAESSSSSSRNDAEMPPPPSAPQCEMALEHFESVDELGQLTVMQMKLMLTRNFVDYRGCCEKAELLEKLSWLWEQKRKHQGDALCEEDMCKICMEGCVDCVILDCGHMCTCTGCGKQLSECPICRQYVVRVVHVFRA